MDLTHSNFHPGAGDAGLEIAPLDRPPFLDLHSWLVTLTPRSLISSMRTTSTSPHNSTCTSNPTMLPSYLQRRKIPRLHPPTPMYRIPTQPLPTTMSTQTSSPVPLWKNTASITSPRTTQPTRSGLS
ncbi:hypothetical protein BDV98DRAFT_268549 [Pterulicium gracile]|uniref:Uncharacterized protein n=1 Tax=Pterulicium gracile TaxID=1884261 RepID=A0A5C3Q572_9AGAR|nr:hypothetical protein BDV98DRAFT_268549 [Pterula gracilis]